ncbi:MAG TPA: magnesium transporter [Phycisphaeraceae bacterium]|nr:magnesium transporter [Phycisphaeraceae bacterium]
MPEDMRHVVDPENSDPQDELVSQMIEHTIDVAALAPEVEKQEPVDAADTLEKLEPEDRSEVIEMMEDEAAAMALSEMVTPMATMVLEELPPEDAARYLTLMDPDDAADLLQELDHPLRNTLLRHLPEDAATELRALLSHDPETAGGLMTTDFVSVRARDTVEKTIARLREEADLDEDATWIYVVDEQGHLAGEVSLLQLLLAPPDSRIADVMDRDVEALHVKLDQEDVAREFDRHDYYVMPVVDDENRLLGVITVDDVIDIIREEATEDTHKMVGAAAGEAVYTGLWQKIRGRFPWLMVNLCTSFVAAVVVLRFSDLIGQLAILAVLMPVIANQAGNSGQQSLAVTLRGLVLDEVRPERVVPLLMREMALGLFTGAVMGSLLCLVIILIGLALPGSGAGWQLGVVAAIAMTVSLGVGCLVGSGVPVLMHRLGKDPATASTIFLTMVTDSTSFMTFLGLAWSMRGWLPVAT